MKTPLKYPSGLLEKIEKGLNLDGPLPKYYQIKDVLKSCIQKRTLRIGDPIPSANVLAERFGTTRVTVDRAINELEKESLVQRIQGRGTFVTEPTPKITTEEIVGLVAPTTGHLFEEFSGNLIRGLMEHHFFPLVVDLRHENGTDFHKTRILAAKQPPFLILSASLTEIPLDYLRHYRGHVIFIYRFELKEEPPASYVLSDVRKGGIMAAEHLLSAGYRRIIHYTHMAPHPLVSIDLIENGIREVIKERGLPDDTLVRWTDPNEESLAVKIKQEKLPIAVMGDSDYRLHTIYDLAEKVGLRIPEDIGLIGWNNTPWCERFRPMLTSLATREDLLAEKVIGIITNKEARGKKTLIPPELVIRDSTARRCD